MSLSVSELFSMFETPVDLKSRGLVSLSRSVTGLDIKNINICVEILSDFDGFPTDIDKDELNFVYSYLHNVLHILELEERYEDCSIILSKINLISKS